jgi:hypothetical protein
MLVSRLLRSLLRFLSPGIVPDEGGGPAADAAPAADAPPADAPAADAPAADPAPAAEPEKTEPADPFAGLNKALEAVSADSAKEPPKPDPTPDPATPKADAKPADKPADIDLTPPEGMTERASQRWAQLTERAKLVPELERKATEVTGQLQAVRELVNGSGLNAAEFADFMETARMFKQGDAKALATLDQLRADLAGRLGVEVPGVDPLAAHADLKADVESMTLTKERALEIARGRDAEKRLQGHSQEQREVAQIRQTVDQGSKAIEQALVQRANTPGHAEKMAHIGKLMSDDAWKQRFVKTYQPHQWADAIAMVYDAYNPPAPAVPAGPQPLRPTASRAGAPVRTGPATAESAVMGAFERMGI